MYDLTGKDLDVIRFVVDYKQKCDDRTMITHSYYETWVRVLYHCPCCGEQSMYEKDDYYVDEDPDFICIECGTEHRMAPHLSESDNDKTAQRLSNIRETLGKA